MKGSTDLHICKLGSCPTLPHGYMVGEGKEGVQTTELTDETLPKPQRHHPAGSTLSTLSRPRLSTPVIDGHDHVFKSPVTPSSGGGSANHNKNRNSSWGARIWRKMMNPSRRKENDVIMTENDDDVYRSYAGDGDAISAVYAELNGSIAAGAPGSVLSQRGQSHSVQSPYQLNTYAEIGEAHRIQRCRPLVIIESINQSIN